jgi:chemotaxis signal transduction protein
MKGMVFSLRGKQDYVVPIENIKEVVLNQSLSSVPGAHKAISGMFYLRGKVIPVIDANLVIENRPLPDSASNKIMICEMDEEVFGLSISQAHCVQEFNQVNKRNTPEKSKLVSGIWLPEPSDGPDSMVIELRAINFYSYVGGEGLKCS